MLMSRDTLTHGLELVYGNAHEQMISIFFWRGVCIHQALADMTLAHLTLAVQAKVCRGGLSPIITCDSMTVTISHENHRPLG